MTNFGLALRSNRLAKIAELIAVFSVAAFAIVVGVPLAGENPLARQAIVWVANVLMLALVWLGLRLRGQD